MASFIEFIHPFRNKPIQDICFATLYFHQKIMGRKALSIEGLRALMHKGGIKRVQKANLGKLLPESAPYIYIYSQKVNQRQYALTSSGIKYVKTMLSRNNEITKPAKDDAQTLRRLVKRLSNPDITQYFDEALLCLNAGAYRASVVFAWAGTIRYIQEKLLECDNSQVNLALKKFNSKLDPVTGIDDFVNVNEKTQILCAEEVGLFDKNQRNILQDALNLRNKSAHPGKYRPGPKKVSSFIEDLIQVVFV